ncbi:hypothetical protein L917_17246, partial [Phytophthora nicotianae]
LSGIFSTKWICDFFTTQPIVYLDEAQDTFRRIHHIAISKITVWRITHDEKDAGERAIHIRRKMCSVSSIRLVTIGGAIATSSFSMKR